METTRKLLYGIPLMLFLLASLAGCNTTAGFGEDVEEAGGFIEEEAEEAENY